MDKFVAPIDGLNSSNLRYVNLCAPLSVARRFFFVNSSYNSDLMRFICLSMNSSWFNIPSQGYSFFASLGVEQLENTWSQREIAYSLDDLD